MRRAFPFAIAALLMPNHPHLVTASEDPEADRCRLARLLGQLGRRFGVRGQVSEVPDPDPIREGIVLARQVRYVALNPCRSRLVRCPLAWRWSTHRDVVGASVDPWVTAPRLAAALGRPLRDFPQRFHGYVSGDPDARVEGTAFPIAAPSTMLARDPLETIADAACAALRVPTTEIRRHGDARALFVALALDQGWRSTVQLANVCACSPHTIRRRAKDVDDAALLAARLCLGDARLRGAAKE